MAAIQINTNQGAFGALTVRTVAQLIDVMDNLQRIQAACANAASGYGGTAGTEYETPMFGVVPSATPGEQGAAYAYAVGTIANAVTAFLSSTSGAIAALDNGA